MSKPTVEKREVYKEAFKATDDRGRSHRVMVTEVFRKMDTPWGLKENVESSFKTVDGRSVTVAGQGTYKVVETGAILTKIK